MVGAHACSAGFGASGDRTSMTVAALKRASAKQMPSFAMQEMLARVRALLRRPGAILGERFGAGNVTFDTRTRCVEVGGRALTLPRSELVVLEALLRRVGRVVERSVLLDQLYGVDESPPLNAVPVHVHHLRRRLEDAGATVEVVTFRGIGYMATAREEATQ